MEQLSFSGQRITGLEFNPSFVILPRAIEPCGFVEVPGRERQRLRADGGSLRTLTTCAFSVESKRWPADQRKRTRNYETEYSHVYFLSWRLSMK